MIHSFKIFAGAMLVGYLFLQWNGFSWDTNEVKPEPTIYSSRGGSGGGSRGFFYSHK